MRAVDTNVVARYVLGDDKHQSSIAGEILSGPCYVSDTVLVETAWLLSSRFGLGRADLAATLYDLLLLPSLTVSDMHLVGWAIGRFASGADFTDMMHILSGRHTDAFVSFEKNLARQAGPGSPIVVEQLD